MTLWNRGAARSSLMGYERTHNPTPAAVSMLGSKAVRGAKQVLRRKGKKRAHRGNPLPAVVGLLSSGIGKKALGLIGIKSGSPRYDGGPLVTTVAGMLELAKQGDLSAVSQLHTLATNPAEKHRVQWAKVWNTELPQLEGALPVAVQREIGRLDPTSVFAARAKAATAASTASRAAALSGCSASWGCARRADRVG